MFWIILANWILSVEIQKLSHTALAIPLVIIPSIFFTNLIKPYIFCADQPMLQLGFNQSITTPSYTCEAECSNQMVAQNNYPLQVFNPILRNSFSMGDILPAIHYNEEPNWYPNGSLGPVIPSGNSPTETFFQFHASTCPPITATWGQSNGILFASSDDDAETGNFSPFPGFVHMSRERKPKAGWCKIRAAIKWWLSVRLAARRMARPSLYMDY